MRKIDKITVLEERAEEGLGVVDDFITALQSAQEDSEELNSEAQAEIDRCKAVQKKCTRVAGFTTKLLKLTK